MKVVKYLISGGSGAVVNLGSFALMVHVFQVWYVVASVISFLFSFAVSFMLQRFWTFNHRTREDLAKHAVLYFGVAVTNLGLNTMIVYILVEYVSVWPLAAQFVGGVIVSLCSFVIYNRYIFAHPA